MIELTMNCAHNFRIEKDWRLNDQHKNKPRLAFRIWFKVYKVQPLVDASGFTLGFASFSMSHVHAFANSRITHAIFSLRLP